MGLVKSSRERSGVGGVDEGKVCRVAWQRQHVHHQQYSTKAVIKMAAQGGEALPVVELRPFTKRVWRREKSLPNFNEPPTSKEDSGADSSRNAGILPPPNIGQFIRELRDQRRTMDTRHSVDSTHRYRPKLHPKADFSFDSCTLAEHKQDLIPSFVSRQERSKTSLGEDSGAGGSVAVGGSGSVGDDAPDRPGGQEPPGMLVRDSSYLMTAYTRDKPLHHQNVCLMGDKIPVAQPGRRHLTYLNPFPLYRPRQAWNTMRLENPPTGLSPRHRMNISFLTREGATLAASSKYHLPPQGLVLSGGLLHNTTRTPQHPHWQRQINPHEFNQKLGAAQDSFLMLSKTGAPTVLEQNLFFDQEVRLERCRRERSFAAVSEVNAPSPSHHLSCDSQPTRGEASLMKAREANKSLDRRKTVPRKNGLDRSLVTLHSFTQQNNFFHRRVLYDSPTSNKSEHGGSGRSYPGEPTEDTPTPFPQNMTTPAISGQPGDNETHKSIAKELHIAIGQERASPNDKTTLQADLESLVESTDEYQRPMSDTAATDTVLVRNEQTPMSADNRARLLPRYGAYLEVINTCREHTTHRQLAENNVDTDPFGFAIEGSDARGETRIESGAETMNTGVKMSNSINPEQDTFLPAVGNTGPLRNGSQGNEASRRGTSAGSVSRKKSSSDDSVELDKGMSSVDSEHCDLVQQNTNGLMSRESEGDHPGRTRNSEVLSVSSSVSSYEKLDMTQDPDEQSPARSGSFTRESVTEETKRSGQSPDASQKMSGVHSLGAGYSVTSNTMLETAGDQRSQLSEHQNLAADDSSEQNELQDIQMSVKSSTVNEPLSSNTSVDKIKITDPQQDNTNRQQTQSVIQPAASDIITTKMVVLKHGQTAFKITPRYDNCTEEDSVSREKAEQDESIEDIFSSGSFISPSQSRENEYTDKPPHSDHAEDSRHKLEKNVSDITNEDEHHDSQLPDGVETIMTVTMETIDNENNYDASKTFLTTANVDSEDWQNMMTV